ncbi:MAG: hypothetical protein GF365_05355 [Candidatus Buchananbacteria bacterium]|nr:hypothetical protein [Candidatus Buchananbacteria bacterium]
MATEAFMLRQEKFFRQGIKALFTRREKGFNYLSTRDCLKIWQAGFYDFNVYSDKKFEEKLKYIHDNPVKHGLTTDISQYKYCSWRNYVSQRLPVCLWRKLADHRVFKIDIN